MICVLCKAEIDEFVGFVPYGKRDSDDCAHCECFELKTGEKDYLFVKKEEVDEATYNQDFPCVGSRGKNTRRG